MGDYDNNLVKSLKDAFHTPNQVDEDEEERKRKARALALQKIQQDSGSNPMEKNLQDFFKNRLANTGD